MAPSGEATRHEADRGASRPGGFMRNPSPPREQAWREAEAGAAPGTNRPRGPRRAPPPGREESWGPAKTGAEPGAGAPRPFRGPKRVPPPLAREDSSGEAKTGGAEPGAGVARPPRGPRRAPPPFAREDSWGEAKTGGAVPGAGRPGGFARRRAAAPPLAREDTWQDAEAGAGPGDMPELITEPRSTIHSSGPGGLMTTPMAESWDDSLGNGRRGLEAPGIARLKSFDSGGDFERGFDDDDSWSDAKSNADATSAGLAGAWAEAPRGVAGGMRGGFRGSGSVSPSCGAPAASRGTTSWRRNRPSWASKSSVGLEGRAGSPVDKLVWEHLEGSHEQRSQTRRGMDKHCEYHGTWLGQMHGATRALATAVMDGMTFIPRNLVGTCSSVSPNTCKGFCSKDDDGGDEPLSVKHVDFMMAEGAVAAALHSRPVGVHLGHSPRRMPETPRVAKIG